jgi:hypothetical protein
MSSLLYKKARLAEGEFAGMLFLSKSTHIIVGKNYVNT